MGFFNKKNAEYEEYHNNDLFSDVDDEVSFFNKQRQNGAGNKHHSVNAPHALTASEVLASSPAEEILMSHAGETVAQRSVYETMLQHERERKEEAAAIDDNYIPSWATATKSAPVVPMETVEVASPEPNVSEPEVSEPKTSKPVNQNPQPIKMENDAATEAFLERCRQAVNKATAGAVYGGASLSYSDDDVVSKKEDKDNHKVDMDDIIRRLRGENAKPKAQEKPVSIDVVITPDPILTKQEPAVVLDEEQEESKTEDIVEEKIVEEANESVEILQEPEVPTEEPIIETAQDSAEVKVDVEVIPVDSPAQIMQTSEQNETEEPESDVRIYGKVVRGAVLEHTPDGDVDVSKIIKAQNQEEPSFADDNEKTRMIGDLSGAISQKATDDLDDFLNEFNEDDDYDEYEDDLDVPYYETEDNLLKDVDEYRSLSDAARIRTDLMAEKSRASTYAIFSGFFTALMAIVSLPFIEFLNAKTTGIINLILLAAVVLVNYGIFKDFKRIPLLRMGFDSCVAIASLGVLVQTALCTFVFDGRFANFGAVAGVLLTVNAIVSKLRVGRVLKGLERIANTETKRAVAQLSSDGAKIVASGVIDGDVVAISGRPTQDIQGYIKNTSYSSPFDLKVKILFFVGIAVAFVGGLIAGLLGDAAIGITLAALLLCLVYPASAILTCELPMHYLSKRLARFGAVLAGYKGAYELNQANVLTVNTADLFPEGTVTLYNMKPLGKNEVAKSLTDAAAVTIAANSPLAPIFKDMIGTLPEKDLPKVDGVQYEDKMGISGWIGERTILIGNRNLMQGHNISVPSATIDQKIHRMGYFPVYIACDGVLCLLFVVKYEADANIASELQRLCNTGMTVVVNPSDPNANDIMISDYFGIPNDAVSIMKSSSRAVYEKGMEKTSKAYASASFGSSICGFFAAATGSINIKNAFGVLTALFLIAAILGVTVTSYLAIVGMLGAKFLPLILVGYQLLFVAVSAIISKVMHN